MKKFAKTYLPVKWSVIGIGILSNHHTVPRDLRLLCVLNRRAVLSLKTLRVNIVFDISPYCVELASLAEQQKLLFFFKHLVHRLASTLEQVPRVLFTGTLDAEKRDILLWWIFVDALLM